MTETEPEPGPAFQLLDRPGEQGRTTVTLLGSLAARLVALGTITGGDAVGSMTAGYAELGRAVARSAPGARLRAAIETSRAGANGEAIWRRLGMDRWVASCPPSAVLDQFHNDVALLAADDIDDALALPIAPAEPYAPGEAPHAEPAAFADYLVGMWFFGCQVVAAIDALVDEQLAGVPTVRPSTAPPAGHTGGPVLR